MSKRYGRNQKRAARARQADLERTIIRVTESAARHWERADMLDRLMRDWARRIVARLGHESAFALDKAIREWNGQESMIMPFPNRMPVPERLDVYAERMTQDLITMFVHHVESTYDKHGGRELKGQLILHLRRGAGHEPLYIALSAQQMDEIRYSKDDQYMEFLVRGLARQFAKHAEEMQRG